MADLEDCRQPPRVVAVLCVARGGVPVPLKQPLSDSEFHLSDPFLTELENNFLLGAKGSMDNKFPPSYSLEENWIVHADFPFVTTARHDLVAQDFLGALPTVHMVRSDGSSMVYVHPSTDEQYKLFKKYVLSEKLGLQLTKVIPDHEHISGIKVITTDCNIGVSQINVACFLHGFLQVLNRGMDGEQGLEVVQEFFCLSEEEKTKLYSNNPGKIRWSSSLDTWNIHNWHDRLQLHCKKVNFKRGFNAMDKLLIEGHNFVSTLNGTILGDHQKIVSVPWFVGKGRPLKSSYNAEHGHAKTIMHALGVQRALMLGAGTGSSYSNAVMVDLWLDSGASCHVVGNEKILSNLHDPPAGGRPLKVADGFEHNVESIGTIDIPGFRIPKVRFIRQFENLISVGQLAEDHNICSYLDKVCCILWVGQERTLVGEGIKDKRNGLYRLTFLVVP